MGWNHPRTGQRSRKGGKGDKRGGREGKGRGDRGSGGKEGGKGREPEHPFDLMETITDLATLPHLPKNEKMMLQRAIETRLTNNHFEEWLSQNPEDSLPRQQLVEALD